MYYVPRPCAYAYACVPLHTTPQHALYYMIVEVLGRPTIPIFTDLGFTICILVVLIVVVVVPVQLVRLAEAIRRDSTYRRQVLPS